MKTFKSIMLYSLLAILLIGNACKKEEYTSRDTSGLKPPPPPPPAPVDPTLVMFDNCDKADGWETVGTPIVQTTGQKEGDGYIGNKITAGNDFMQFIKKRVPALDSKLTKENAQLMFWLYIEDPTKLKLDGQIQVSSSGAPDNLRIGWALANIIPNLKSGWNQLILNFNDGEQTGDGPPDFAALNFFKVFFWTASKATADLAVGVDGIQLRAAPTSTPGTSDAVVIDNADKADGWETIGGAPAIITTGQKEGAGYIQGTMPTADNFMQFIKKLPSNLDTKATIAGGQLQFWINIPDPGLLKADGQIQFSSAGDPDKNRIGWSFAKIIPNLKAGWNQVKLNLSDGEMTGDGGPDLKAMNFFKIFFWNTDKPAAPINFGLDDIKIVQSAPAPALMVDNCDQIPAGSWQTIGEPKLITSGAKEGTGYIQGMRDGGDNFFQFIRPFATPIDTKLNINNGQLQFWLNVPDPSALDNTQGQIQFSSSGDPDKNRIGWGMDKVIPTLKPGWNFLKLDFSADGMTGDGGPDFSKMNFIKIFFWLKEKPAQPVNFGIDGIQVQRRP